MSKSLRYKLLIIFLHSFLTCEATKESEEIGIHEVRFSKQLRCQCIQGGMLVTADDQFFLSKSCTFNAQGNVFTFYNVVKKYKTEDEEILPAGSLEAIEQLLYGLIPYLSGQLEKNITQVYDIFDRDIPKAIDLIGVILTEPFLFRDIWGITEESLRKKLFKVMEFLNRN